MICFKFFLSQVTKNGVRLSSSLSDAMGNPVLGGAVFVYPVKSETVPSHLTKDENSRSTMVDPLLVYNCGELFLELVHSRKLTRTSASVKISSEPSYERSGNGVVRSSFPKTPMNHTKVGSSVTNQLTSPVCDDSLANLTNSNGSSFDPFDITKLLGDEGVTKRLIEARAAPFFHSRCLLRGNLVTLPILSQLCIFRVVGAKKLSEDRADYDFTNVSGNNLLNEASESLQHSTNAFIVVNETKVSLCFPSELASKTPQREGLSTVDFEHKDVKADSGDNNFKLGGLSKEYAILKDIIVSSSMNTLSRYVISYIVAC